MVDILSIVALLVIFLVTRTSPSHLLQYHETTATMDASNLRARHSSSPNDDKAGGYGYDYEYEQTGQIRGIETDPQTSLHRGLKARHISMIAIGGAIGTGCMNLPSSSPFFASAHSKPAPMLT